MGVSPSKCAIYWPRQSRHGLYLVVNHTGKRSGVPCGHKPIDATSRGIARADQGSAGMLLRLVQACQRTSALVVPCKSHDRLDSNLSAPLKMTPELGVICRNHLAHTAGFGPSFLMTQRSPLLRPKKEKEDRLPPRHCMEATLLTLVSVQNDTTHPA